MSAEKKRWLHLAAGTVIMTFLGLIYAWSTFVAPLEREFGWNRAQTSLTFTISVSVFAIGLIVSGLLARRIKIRQVFFIAATCLLTGFGLCSRANTLIALYIFYGIFVGFGGGLANSTIVSSIVRWFPDRSGLASGIMMMGFGLGGLVFGRLAVMFFSILGWRMTFLMFGISFAVIMAVGSIWIVPPPDNFSIPIKSKKSRPQIEGALDIGGIDVVKRQSFWFYIVWFALMIAGGLIVIGHASPYAQDLGLSAGSAALAAGVFSLSNGAGRVLCGFVFDKFGLRKSMTLTTCYIVVSAALLTLSCIMSNIPLMIAGFVFAGLSYGGGPTTCSTFASSFYGMTYFSINYGVMSLGMIPGSIAGPWLAGMLRSTSGGYLSSFIVMVAFGLCALLSLRFIRKP